MGTRSLTHIKGETGKTLVTLYRQFDGDPTGIGQEIADFCKARKLIDGIGEGENASNSANGMGCLAAQLITHLKGGDIGSVYVYVPDATDCWEDYVYTVYPKDDETHFRCATSDGVTLFDGPVRDFSGKTVESDAEAT